MKKKPLYFKRHRNPTESELIELSAALREDTKTNILKMLQIVENQLNASGLTLEYGVISLLRRQYARGDIDRETLFHWLRVEGLLK